MSDNCGYCILEDLKKELEKRATACKQLCSQFGPKSQEFFRTDGKRQAFQQAAEMVQQQIDLVLDECEKS